MVSQVSNQPGLVTQQGAALSQLVALPPAQQPTPLPHAAAAAAAPTADTALPQLSVQTSLKLQTQNPSLQPDLTSQLHHAVSRPLTAQPDNAVWALPPFAVADFWKHILGHLLHAFCKCVRGCLTNNWRFVFPVNQLCQACCLFVKVLSPKYQLIGCCNTERALTFDRTRFSSTQQEKYCCLQQMHLELWKTQVGAWARTP